VDSDSICIFAHPKNDSCFSFSLNTFTYCIMHHFYRLSIVWFLLLLGITTGLYGQQMKPVRFGTGPQILPVNIGAVGLMKPDAAEIHNGYYTRYIQCAQIPTETEKRATEAAGIRFVSYLNNGAYLVLIPEKFDLRQLERLHVGSVVPVQPSWKMAKSLRERPLGAWAVFGDRVHINIQLYPHISIADGADLCQRAGMEILKRGNQNGFLKVSVHKDDLETVAALPFIRALELVQQPGKPEDTKGRALHRSNLLDSEHATGKKYNGEGVSVLVRDDGQLGPHIDFQGRLFNIAETPQAAGTHGDGVGGIIGGAGNLDPSQKGMAAGARVFATDYEAEYQDTTLWLFQNENVTITNSSYSNGCNIGYSLSSQTVDQQIYDNPTLMHVFSAGNANGSDCDYGAGDQWGNIQEAIKCPKTPLLLPICGLMQCWKQVRAAAPPTTGA
jgi:hypothetical protein